MKMRVLLALAALATTVAASPDRVAAADLEGSGAYAGGGHCFLMRRSPILDLASVDQMEVEVGKRYEHALSVSLADSTIASRSPRFAWSNEAKVACGKAIGYFKGREVNEEMISKCDCFHGRMLSFMSSSWKR
jgi:hypothetical protein